MNLCIIGCGYVGLVTGTCFAEMGNDVICVDNDPKKIKPLEQGESPIYEPGLTELLKRNLAARRLRFTMDLADAVREAEIIFICVGTPPADDGSTDLTAMLSVTRALAPKLNGYKVIVVKSTVPVGTCELIRNEISAISDQEFDVVSNPEFLKEGAALEDFFRPDRVVVGAESEQALMLMQELYAPFLRTGKPLIAMSTKSSEMTKHASNAMLAVRISFINEIAGLCEAVGADVREVRNGMASDARIGSRFLFPGLGFGGSCFPKDIRSLADVGRRAGFPMLISEAASETNQRARERFLERIVKHFDGELNGRKFAFWGLAFKPGTDDVREAPALWLIRQIRERWPQSMIAASDPVAIHTAQADLADLNGIEFYADEYQTLDHADALVVCTEWNEFRSPNFNRIKQLLMQPVIFDGRNLYDPAQMRDYGIIYYSVGRPT